MSSMSAPWEVYRDASACLGNGHALWEPGPIYSYQRVNLGDVGYIRRGRFHLLFSAGIALGSRVLGTDVPSTFEPLEVGPIIPNGPRSPGYLRTPTISQVGVDNCGSFDVACSVGPGVQMSFELTSKQGAVLITNHSTFQEDVERERNFEIYIKKHYGSWVDFARDTGHAVDIKPILVTGVDLTKQYAMVAYSGNRIDIECDFSVADPAPDPASLSAWGSWRASEGLVHKKCGPSSLLSRGGNHSGGSSASESTIPTDHNQCVFIRYYTMRWRFWVIKAGGGPHQLPGRNVGNDGAEAVLIKLPDSSEDLAEGSYLGAELTVTHNPPLNDRDHFDVFGEFVFQRSNATSLLLHCCDVQNFIRESEQEMLQLLEESAVSDRVEVDESGVGQLVQTVNHPRIGRFSNVIDSQCEKKNIGPSEVMSSERESKVQGPLASVLTVAVDDIKRDGSPRKSQGYKRRGGVEPVVVNYTDGHAIKGTGNTGMREADPRGMPDVVTEGFSSLKVIMASILAAHANREGIFALRNKVDIFLSRIAVLETRFDVPPSDLAEQRRREELIHQLMSFEKQLRTWLEEQESRGLTDRVQGDDSALGLLEDIQEAILNSQIVWRKTLRNQAFEHMDLGEALVLNSFRCAQGAEYGNGNRNGCLKGTRRATLDEIELWAYDFDRPPVYWLNGLAGTGKTTIAQTVAERTFADGRLGASFFCSRDFEDRNNLQFIFPTLAVQLARTYPEFRSIFVPLVKSDPSVAHESLWGQINKLIVQPLAKSSISTVIVIDALDECNDEEPASAILSVLGQFVAEIPKVKFFVTGRPEPRIREGFRLPSLAKATDVFVLHEVEPGQVNNDIRLFFAHSFTELKQRRHVLDDWPAQGQLDLLCERAGGLFAYAVATVRFIDHRDNNPKRQLDRLLLSPESSAFEGKTKFKVNATLDLLYMTIIHEAFGDDDPEDDPKVRSVLGAVVLSANPLSPSTMAVLLGFDVEDVSLLLSSIHSLLVLREDVNHTVRPFHKSFPEFMVDPSRCTDVRFRVCRPDQHTELFLGCLKLMDKTLEQNMCKLPDGAMNLEVDDLRERAEKYIGEALEYACRSWHKHLIHTSPAQTPEIVTVLQRFLEEKFMFWLEVLSVLGVAREAVDALETTTKWFDVSPTASLARDCFRFVITFFDLITTSASHIYISALPLAPRESIVRKLYGEYARPSARVVWGLQTFWDPEVAVVSHRDFAGEAVWSPCNRFIAITKSASVEILDAVTLRRLNTFELLQDSTPGKLCFSPDCRVLFRFSDGEVTRWDVQTGAPASVIFSEGLDASRGNFSFVCSMDGTMLAVAYSGSSSSDTSIATHHLPSGVHTGTVHIPDARVATPIWTSGECLHFATVKLGSITIWEVEFTLIRPPTEVESLTAPEEIARALIRPARGEIVHAGNFIFLPTLFRLAFTHENSIFIWDARSSGFLLNSRPSSVPIDHTATYFHGGSFSSDGRLFACATSNQEVHVWKEFAPTGYVLHQKLGLFADHISVGPLISPFGGSIIVGHGSKIRLWSTEDQILPPFEIPTERTGRPNSVLGLSPDGMLATFAQSMDKTVTVLDLQSGDPLLVVEVDMEISCLGVAGTTAVVVGGGKIIAWNLPTESGVYCTRVNVGDSVRTINLQDFPLHSVYNHSTCMSSISPDLTRIAVVGQSGHHLPADLRIYDAFTGSILTRVSGQHLLRPWFTPDGHEVWSVDESSSFNGWKIIEDGEPSLIRPECLETTACPQGGFPWHSRLGYKVTEDGSILSPTGERLLWLPPRWRSGELSRTWNGRFLGLWDRELPEVVILEFFN